MLFHWYLFVFLFVLYIIADLGDQTYQVCVSGELELRYKWFTAFAVITVLTFVAAIRSPSFIDTISYYIHYMKEPGTLESAINRLIKPGKDKAFYALTALLKGLLGDHIQIYFAIISGFSLLLVFSAYRKHSCNFLISAFLFIASGEYVQWTHNGIRQFIAVSIVFAATDLLLQRRYILYTFLVLLASTFHASSLIMLPAVFVVLGKAWNRRLKLTLIVVLVLSSSSSLLLNLLVTIMENTQYVNDVHSLMNTGGTNVFRVLVFCVPPLLTWLFREPIALIDNPRVNLMVNMSVVSMCLYIVSMFTSGIYVGRLPIYFSLHNYLLLPWIIDRFFVKSSGKLIYMLLITCYMIFYYYQMHVVWGDVIIV